MWKYNQFVSSNELYHYGIPGMKWGIRRYENSDGSLTTAGKQRYSKGKRKLTDKQKKIIRNVAIGAGATAAIAGLGYLGYRKLQPTYLKEAIGSTQNYGKKVAPDMQKYYNNEILRISKNTNVVNPYKKSGMPFKAKGVVNKPLSLPAKSSYVKPSLKTSDIAGKKFKISKSGLNKSNLISGGKVKTLKRTYSNNRINKVANDKIHDLYSSNQLNNKKLLNDTYSDWKKNYTKKGPFNWTPTAPKNYFSELNWFRGEGPRYGSQKMYKLANDTMYIGNNRKRIARAGMRHSDIYSDELYHHGVLGMKWGVRKLSQRAINRRNRRKKAIANIRKDWESIPKPTRRAIAIGAGVAGSAILTRGISRKIANAHTIKSAVQGSRGAAEMFKNGGSAERAEHFVNSAANSMNKAIKADRVARNIRKYTRPVVIGGLGTVAVGGGLEYARRAKRKQGQKRKGE